MEYETILRLHKKIASYLQTANHLFLVCWWDMGGAGTGGAVSGGEDAAAKRRKLERKLREVVEENNRLKEELGRARYRIKRLSSTHQCVKCSHPSITHSHLTCAAVWLTN